MSQEAIDGTEQFADADPRSALAAFYRAFNEVGSRNLLLKNWLDVGLLREHGRWLIARMVFRNIWKEGDPEVLFPPNG